MRLSAAVTRPSEWASAAAVARIDRWRRLRSHPSGRDAAQPHQTTFAAAVPPCSVPVGCWRWRGGCAVRVSAGASTVHPHCAVVMT